MGLTWFTTNSAKVKAGRFGDSVGARILGSSVGGSLGRAIGGKFKGGNEGKRLSSELVGALRTKALVGDKEDDEGRRAEGTLFGWLVGANVLVGDKDGFLVATELAAFPSINCHKSYLATSPRSG